MKCMACVLIALALPLAAQKLDLSKPPESPEQHPYKLPPVTETQLSNGLTVITAEDARFPLITVRLAFKAGTKRDPKELSGTASAAGSMLMQGTTSRTYQQLAEELDSLGAFMGAGSSPDATVISGSAVAENAPKLLALIADVARNANFPDNELSLYKQNRKQELLAVRSRAAYLANEEFRKRVFGDHPYGRPAPTPEAIDKLTPGILASYRDTYMVPNNAYLIVVGKLPERATLAKLISDQFGSWARKDVPTYTPAPVPAPKKQLVLVDRPGSVQADVRIGRVTVSNLAPDFFPEVEGAMILGGGPKSRLFLDIREKRGYAYDVHTETDPLGDAGNFSTVTQVRNEVVPEALKGVMDLMDGIAKEQVSKDELSGAKSFINGTFLLRMEPQSGLADQLERIRILNLPKDYLETYTTKINSVEPEQILNAAKKYLTTESDVVVVVGDAAKIEQGLSGKLGKFEVVKPN